MGGLICCLIDRLTLIKTFSRGRDGAVVRELATHLSSFPPCGSGSSSRPGVMRGLSLFLVLVLDQGFFRGSPVFLPSAKPLYNEFKRAVPCFVGK